VVDDPVDGLIAFIIMVIYKRLKYDGVINKLLILISGTALTILLSSKGTNGQIIISVFLSFVLQIIIIFKFDIFKIFCSNSSRENIIISLFLSLATCAYFTKYFYSRCFNNKLLNILSKWLAISNSSSKTIALVLCVSIGALSVFAVFLLYKTLLDKVVPGVVEFLKCLNKQEKLFLLISFCVSVVGVSIIYNLTNAFYSPFSDKDGIIDYQVIYTTDSGNQLLTNIYLNVNADENDIRQPLFGLFATPFGIIAKIISKILFFIPHSYAIVMTIIQILLLAISSLLLTKLLYIEKKDQAIFLLLISTSYPYLVFSFVIEQYIFSTFYLILFIYMALNKKKMSDYCFIGATGSLVTSGILFPFLSHQKIPGKYSKEISIVLLKALIIIIVFGRLPLILNSFSSIKSLLRFTGNSLTFNEKILQYLNFIASCFTTPKAAADFNFTSNVSYQLIPISKVNMLGVIVLIFAIIGFALNYKKTYIRICFEWMIYSFIMFCIVGWGTLENGLVIYSLYFTWAVVSLLYMAFNKLLNKTPKIKMAVFSCTILAFAIINFQGLFEIIKFGIKYYPIRW